MIGDMPTVYFGVERPQRSSKVEVHNTLLLLLVRGVRRRMRRTTIIRMQMYPSSNPLQQQQQQQLLQLQLQLQL